MKSVTLIDLDVLLDTRLGSLFEIDPEEAFNILNNGWHERKSDDLKGLTEKITAERYKRKYENRDKYTLSVSRMTNIIKVLAFENQRFLMHKEEGNAPFENYCIVINTHPYNLDEEEETQIAYALQEIMGGEPPIKFIKLLPESTRLSYLDMHGFTDYITYDINKWLVQEFDHCQTPEDFVMMPHITVWGPRMFLTSDILQQVLTEYSNIDERDCPFTLMKVTAAPFVRLEFIPVDSFSIINTPV